jgi:hypothetical protein
MMITKEIFQENVLGSSSLSLIDINKCSSVCKLWRNWVVQAPNFKFLQFYRWLDFCIKVDNGSSLVSKVAQAWKETCDDHFMKNEVSTPIRYVAVKNEISQLYNIFLDHLAYEYDSFDIGSLKNNETSFPIPILLAELDSDIADNGPKRKVAKTTSPKDFVKREITIEEVAIEFSKLKIFSSEKTQSVYRKRPCCINSCG